MVARNAFAPADLYFQRKFKISFGGQNPAKPAQGHQSSLQPNFQTHGPRAWPPPPTLPDSPRLAGPCLLSTRLLTPPAPRLSPTLPDSPPTLPDSPRLRLSPDSPRLSPTLARSPAAQKSPNTDSAIDFRGFRAPLGNLRAPGFLLVTSCPVCFCRQNSGTYSQSFVMCLVCLVPMCYVFGL